MIGTAPTIVIADDTEQLLKMISGIVERFMVEKGTVATIVRAKDGLEALAAIEEHKPAFVVTDYQMPGQNGAEVVRKARTDLNYAGGIIMVTSAVQDAKDELGEHHESTDVLGKPFHNRSLRDLLEKHYQKHL